MKIINFFLQFLFIRLTRCEEKLIDRVSLREVSIISNNEVGIGGECIESRVQKWYALQYWILPLTGWCSDFIYLTKNKRPKFFRLTNKENI